METIKTKSYETTLDVIPKNSMIIVEMPVVSKRSPGGLIKTDKQLAEEAQKLPTFVNVVAIADDVYDVAVGDYVMLGAGTQVQKVKVKNIFYALVHSSEVVAKAKGELETESKEMYEKYRNEFLIEQGKIAKSIIFDASL